VIAGSTVSAFALQWPGNLIKVSGREHCFSGWNLRPLLFDANAQAILTIRNMFCLIKIV
jgi:hypothetical protein